MYDPKPVDTSGVELEALTELIAANVHNLWGAGRIAEGWKYGEKRIPKGRLPIFSFLTTSFRNQKRITTEIPPCRP